ncbi:LD-carboxypeptidase [Roseateles puraquae]|uniref:LD-carboxypeptidase n=1 Tax=Roseateles puraquae TaxID=431059 RepID=A0A254N863_9BURK|nr:LD-carboxypeptidase [Roseateles puraquae]MDG0852356.1 LD-carboxypeptidase [Roseateles puraquae]OWR04206.1 LD-carboxypeptidase [Roseateles puraquae]
MTSLTLFTPAGALAKAENLKRAARRLGQLGFDVTVDADALARHQRFAGDDATRLAALHRVADAAPSVALATRGGYGMTRLLDQIDWDRVARSIEHGTRWVGYSDLTALQNGLIARKKGLSMWAGPLACDDFGRSEADGGVDEVTRDCFLEAMSGALEAVGFRAPTAEFDGLEVRGRLWGGNLTVLCSLLGTPHWPKVKGGVLFLEDINEHPYRVERMLLQLQQAGVIDAQAAVLLGDFSGAAKSPLDRGYGIKDAVGALRSRTRTPVLTGLPFGHIRTKVCLPVGATVEMFVQGREAILGWQSDARLAHHHAHDHDHAHH